VEGCKLFPINVLPLYMHNTALHMPFWHTATHTHHAEYGKR